MEWVQLISAIALASQLAWGADSPGGKAPPAGEATGTPPSVRGVIAPVLRPSEPPDTRVIMLPGPPKQRSVPSHKPAATPPRKTLVLKPLPIAPAKPLVVSEPPPLPPATPAVAPVAAPVQPIRKALVLKPQPVGPSSPPVVSEPPPLLPAAPAVAPVAAPVQPIRKTFAPGPPPVVSSGPPVVSEPPPLLPASPAVAPVVVPVQPIRKTFVLKPPPAMPANPPIVSAPPPLPPQPATPPPPPTPATGQTAPGNQPAAGREPSKPEFPGDFARDSALYCQKQIGQWLEAEARALLGHPLRQRPAYDDNDLENGRISAFSDPSGRYQELELDFAKSGRLRAVFVYPRGMTWQECRRLWGANVRSTEANKGRIFYSYTDRRLDVLVDPGGKVISLGLY